MTTSTAPNNSITPNALNNPKPKVTVGDNAGSDVTLKKAEPKIETKPELPVAPVIIDPAKEKKFQVYHSAKASVRTMTDKGKRISFCAYEFITEDKDIIAFLNEQIEQKGLSGITKGALVSAEDKDPMAVLKRKHFAEFLADQAKAKADAANGIFPDMGDTKPAGVPRLNPTHSGQTAN